VERVQRRLTVRTDRGHGACQVRLGVWPTPLQPLDDRGGRYVKREDLCGFAFGGSKVRAIEPLLRDALARGASSLVTGGRRDSSWVALTALAAARLGLGCHCVLDPGPGKPLAMRLARRRAAARLLVLPHADVRSPLADRLAARSGVLLDPVFTGPAWHAYCASWAEPAAVGDRRAVVLVASGGLPACFDELAADPNLDAGP
jgi:1-aminocyclopropane-1-carboxylate deaminase/D-cysteine desulfhydrase-like pyridoxal-dependent ACC family enzyme